MSRFGLFLSLWLGLLWHGAFAGSYALTDGSSVSGDPVNYDINGVILKTGADSFSDRIPWGKLTDEALRQLRDDTRNPQYKAIVAPMILNLAPVEKARLHDIAVKAVETPARPSGHLGVWSVFTSLLGWAILMILYATNIFAAYEVALFRNQPPATVCGLAAIPFLGVASPVIFLALPSRPAPEEEPSADSGEPDPASYTPPSMSSVAAAGRGAQDASGSLAPSAGGFPPDELPAPPNEPASAAASSAPQAAPPHTKTETPSPRPMANTQSKAC